MFSLTLLLLVVHTVVPVSSKLQCQCYNSRYEIHVHVRAPSCTNHYEHNGICNVCWNRLLSDSFAKCGSTQIILHQGSYSVSRNTKKLMKKTNSLDITGEPMATISCTKYDFIFKISRTFTTAYKIIIRNLRFQNCREILIESNVKSASIEIMNSSLTNSCLRIHGNMFFLSN